MDHSEFSNCITACIVMQHLWSLHKSPQARAYSTAWTPLGQSSQSTMTYIYKHGPQDVLDI